MNSLMKLETNNHISMWDQAEQLSQIKAIYGKDLDAGEFNTLVQIGRATGLNPFLREIWAVKYGKNSANIFVGRDGYRKSAQANPLYDYHVVDAVYSSDEFYVVDGDVKHKYTLTNRGNLIGAYCVVKRKDSSKPTFAFVEFKEYDTKQSLWKTKPATMIKKVAEAQALRLAFQALFAGTYDESENWYPEKNIIKKEKPVNEPITGELIKSDDNHLADIKNKIELSQSLDELKSTIKDINALSNDLFAEKKSLMKCYLQRKSEFDKN